MSGYPQQPGNESPADAKGTTVGRFTPTMENQSARMSIDDR
jgi:hypothetical protein